MNQNTKKNELDAEAGTYAQTGFEYQTIITTHISLMMYVGLDGHDTIRKIYSELKDDILLLTNVKKWIVIQVTYNNSNTPFRLNDPPARIQFLIKNISNY